VKPLLPDQGGVELGIGQLAGLHAVGRDLPVLVAQQHQALAPGGGTQPAGQRLRFTEILEIRHQPQPHRAADILGVRAADPVTPADRGTSEE
jgi:hypothetical protein